MDHSTDHDMDHGTDHDMDHGTDHDMDHGTDHDMDHGTDHDMDHGTDHDMDHSTDHDMDHSTDHDMDHGTDHDMDHGTDQREPPTEDRLIQTYKILKTGSHYALGHPGHHGQLESIRQFKYKEHEVVIRTHYTITVDGQSVNPHVHVDNKGRLNTHAIPNYSFNSAVDMMKALIDCLPSSFTK